MTDYELEMEWAENPGGEEECCVCGKVCRIGGMMGLAIYASPRPWALACKACARLPKFSGLVYEY